MDEKDNRYGNSKFITFFKVFFGIAIFLMLGFFIIGQTILPDERDGFDTKCEVFVADWYQIMNNGEKVSVELPGKVEAQKGEVVTLSTVLTEDIIGDEVLCFRPIWQDVEIYIDGELRASYNTKDSRPFGSNSAFRYVFADISDEDVGKELVYKFSSDSKYAGTMRNIHIGDKLGVLGYLVKESGLRTMITVFLLFLSTFCILVCAILKYVYKKSLPLSYLVWTMMFSSIWMLSEIEFRQLVFKNVSVLTCFTYFSLMIIPIPLMIYINEIQGYYYKKLHAIPIVYAGVVLTVCTTLQILNIVDFVQMIPYMHFGIIIAIVITIITIIMDVVKRRISEYAVVGIGICGLLISALTEMILYYIDTSISIGTMLAMGLIFLLVMAIMKTGQDLMRSEKNKQKAIMAREAQAKFLANMSHEIRTPINAVIGMNEMILRESKDKEILDYAGNIKSASNMLLRLISNILDFSKIESGQLELAENKYDVTSMIRDEKLILDTRASEKQLSVMLNISPDIPSKLYGDELRIKQVVTNLISNAVKYTNEGTIELSVGFNYVDADNIKLKISVIDTGIGIKKEDMSQLFDNFKRFDLDKNRNIQGTGLGLSIVKQLVDLMNGNIDVYSEYGKGSKFTITIPQKVMDRRPIGNIDEFMGKSKKINDTQKESFTAPDARILVVDDNLMNLSVIKALLKRTKIKVETASGGRECIEATGNNKYDIILLDHMMPELDGVETLKIIREDYLNLNQNGIIIALTANAVAGCRDMYLKYGFTDYFAKPIEADKLDELLLRYLPSNLIHKENVQEENKEVMTEDGSNKEIIGDLLEIDRSVGLSYCAESEEVYNEVLSMFCEQCTEYLPLFEQYVMDENWSQYAVIAHGLKSNALTIGAVNFSKLSLKHEMAGKNNDALYIKSEYKNYIENINKLVDKVNAML